MPVLGTPVQPGPLQTSDNASTGATAGKPTDGHPLSTHPVVIFRNVQGGPAPFNVQRPPHTHGRPI